MYALLYVRIRILLSATSACIIVVRTHTRMICLGDVLPCKYHLCNSFSKCLHCLRNSLFTSIKMTQDVEMTPCHKLSLQVQSCRYMMLREECHSCKELIPLYQIKEHLEICQGKMYVRACGLLEFNSNIRGSKAFRLRVSFAFSLVRNALN